MQEPGVSNSPICGSTPRITLGHFDKVSNPKSIHGIYPYRGKMSAIDAAYVISQLPSDVSPAIGNRSWIMTAEIQRPNKSIDGVIFTYGTQNVGLSCYIKDDQLVFDYNIYITILFYF